MIDVNLYRERHPQQRWPRPVARWAGVVAVAAACGGALAQPCATEWAEVGGGTSGLAVFGATVHSFAVWDDGSGPALYIAGAFTEVGGLVVNRVAKWDGNFFLPVGSGIDQTVSDLAVYDDGSGRGPELYAFGGFDSADGLDAFGVARFDGQFWWPVGDGVTVPGEAATTAAVFDDGSGGGPALYVGGYFTTVAGQTANRLAKWDGAAWSPVGLNDIDRWVKDLVVFDDGTGPALYAGGELDVAGGVPVNNIARWNGLNWSALGDGVIDPGTSTNGTVLAMAVFDDGTGGGPDLYVGGEFDTAGGQPASNIAKWDGDSWSALGSGASGPVTALTVYDDGSGPALYVGGEFRRAGGIYVNSIARWDGQAWSTIGITAIDPGEVAVDALIGFDDGAGSALYAGGEFTMAGGAPAANLARWVCNPVGACCMPSGACEMVPEITCGVAGGTYHGDGVDCASVPPCPQPPTGACCLPTGCQTMWQGACAELGGVYQGDNIPCGNCLAFVLRETEPNNEKVGANYVILEDGEAIVGVATASTGVGDPASPDYFKIQTTPAPLGIYRHDLVLDNPTAATDNRPSLRFRAQEITQGSWPCPLGTPSPGLFGGADVIGTFATTEPRGRVVTWYGFGQEEQIYYKVHGDETTTGVYRAHLETAQITPTDIGNFQSGQITIQTPETPDVFGDDTVLCIFDENLDPIPGYANDDAAIVGGAPADSTERSFLRRTYQPGTYYLALGVGAMTGELPAPCDYDPAPDFVLPWADFPNSVYLYAATFLFDVDEVLSFSVTDSAGTTDFPAIRGSANAIAWFRFMVGDAPPHCAADLDGVGGVDVFDLLAYLDLWFAGDAAAELTGDSPVSVDVFDLLAYLDLWFAGC